MNDILPAAPHGTTDQMSPTHAAVPVRHRSKGVTRNERERGIPSPRAPTRELLVDANSNSPQSCGEFSLNLPFLHSFRLQKDSGSLGKGNLWTSAPWQVMAAATSRPALDSRTSVLSDIATLRRSNYFNAVY